MTRGQVWLWAYALILLSAGITLAFILVGRRRRMLGWALLIALSAWVAVWLVGDRLRASGWTDIDGFIDCTRCDAWHTLGAWLFFAPPISGILAVAVAALVLLIDWLRAGGPLSG